MTSAAQRETPLDLELIAQRVLKLAEIATLEHVESLLRSQAGDFLAGNALESDWAQEQPSAAHAA